MSDPFFPREKQLMAPKHRACSNGCGREGTKKCSVNCGKFFCAQCIHQHKGSLACARRSWWER